MYIGGDEKVQKDMIMKLIKLFLSIAGVVLTMVLFYKMQIQKLMKKIVEGEIEEQDLDTEEVRNELQELFKDKLKKKNK